MIGKKNIFQLPPRVLSEEGEQKHDADASLMNDCNKMMLALAPRSQALLLLLLLLLAHRDPTRRRMWLKTARPNSRRPEVSTGDAARPPVVLQIQRPTLDVARPHVTRRIVTTRGSRTRSAIAACREGRHGCEQTEVQ